MNIPLEIDYRHIEPSPAIEAALRERVAKLERYHPRLIGCRATVEAAHHHHHKGYQYQVHLRLLVPGATVNVSRDAERGHEDLYVAIRDAFDAARRQLEDEARVRRGDVKQPHPARTRSDDES
jgi:ribosomal subunit interface protein